MTDKKKIKKIIKLLEKARAELIKIKVWGIRFKSCDENISKALSKLRELLCPTWVGQEPAEKPTKKRFMEEYKKLYESENLRDNEKAEYFYVQTLILAAKLDAANTDKEDWMDIALKAQQESAKWSIKNEQGSKRKDRDEGMGGGQRQYPDRL